MRLVTVMEWNSKTPLEWDLENLAMYGSRTFEIPTRLQCSSHKIDENGRIYSSGVGSGSDLGYGSQNSFSASEDTSVKEGLKSFGTVDILKLGRQTYFEDMYAAKSTSCSVDPSSSCPTTKRTRQSNQSMQTQCCQVEGCNLDLVSAKGYHRRHKICESHSKSPKVIVAGMERRFCQQCSRFHDLSEFDDKKRSCRRRLSNHNARRRRPQPEATQLNSAQLYDPHPRMNRVPIPAANRAWGTDCHLTGTLASDSRITPAKVGNNALSSVEVITHRGRTLYNDASAMTCTLDDRHAPSLLSSNSWASNESEPTSLEQLVHGNHISLAETHSNLQNWAVTPSWSRTHLLDFNSHFQHHPSAHESDSLLG